MRPPSSLLTKYCCSLLELQLIGMSHMQVKSYIHATWNKPPLASIHKGFSLHQSTTFFTALSFSGMYYIRLYFSLGLKKKLQNWKKTLE